MVVFVGVSSGVASQSAAVGPLVLQVKELAKDLRDQLEVIGVSTLKGALGMDGAGELSVSGSILSLATSCTTMHITAMTFMTSEVCC